MYFNQVTVVERDLLPTATAARKGVPQGNHAHVLLPSGYDILEEYFPGMMRGLAAAGAPQGDMSADFLWYQYGTWKLRTRVGLHGIGVTRPFLEFAVRERVRTLPVVEFLEEHDAEEPVFDAAAGSVTGVTVKNRATGESRTLNADLVVDALGRGSPSPTWLSKWGFGDVAETNVTVDVGYATALFERHPEDMRGAPGAILAGTAPKSKRYAAVIGAEGDRWVVTLVGCLRDYPPTDITEWKAFAHSLPVPDLYDMIKDREPLGPPSAYRYSANRRRHFEWLSRFPGGYLIVGDAYCCFNPIYGQGMTVALIEARALDDCLRIGTEGLAHRFLAEATKIVADPWAIATGEDYRYPEVQGLRPPGFAVVRRYLDRVHRAASRDPVVLKQLFEVVSLLAPPTTLLAPRIAWRVLLGGLSPSLRVQTAIGR